MTYARQFTEPTGTHGGRAVILVDDIADRLEGVADLRTAVGALAVFVLATLLVQTVGVRPEVTQMAGDLTLPETQLAYSPGDVDAVLEALGSDGRSMYTEALLIDFVFVLTFAAGLGIPLAYLLPRLSSAPWIGRLAAAPVLAGLCDYVENVVLLYSIEAFPDTSEPLLWISSAFTSVKLVLLVGSILLLLVAVVVVGGRALLART